MVYALYLAYKDSRTPWYARLFCLLLVAYAFSPIDLIPDPIPILGHLDDLVLIPIGVLVAVKMIPPPLLDEYRMRAEMMLKDGKPRSRLGVAIVVVLWLLLAAGAAVMLARYAGG